MMHKAWCSMQEVPYCFLRSSIKFQGHTGQNIANANPKWAFPDCNSRNVGKMWWTSEYYHWIQCIMLYMLYSKLELSFLASQSVLAVFFCKTCKVWKTLHQCILMGRISNYRYEYRWTDIDPSYIDSMHLEPSHILQACCVASRRVASLCATTPHKCINGKNCNI